MKKTKEEWQIQYIPNAKYKYTRSSHITQHKLQPSPQEGGEFQFPANNIPLHN